MPKHLVESWKMEVASWLKANGIIYNPLTWADEVKRLPQDVRRSYVRLAGAKLDGYLDTNAGSCLLKRKKNARAVADALRHFDGEKVYSGDFVVMPNHVHWLLQPGQGCELGTLLQSVKSYCGSQINRFEGRSGRLWQRGSYDHIVRDSEELTHYRQYIERNAASAKTALFHRAEWSVV